MMAAWAASARPPTIITRSTATGIEPASQNDRLRPLGRRLFLAETLGKLRALVRTACFPLCALIARAPGSGAGLEAQFPRPSGLSGHHRHQRPRWRHRDHPGLADLDHRPRPV